MYAFYSEHVQIYYHIQYGSSPESLDRIIESSFDSFKQIDSNTACVLLWHAMQLHSLQQK